MESCGVIGVVISFVLCVSGISIEGQLTVIRNDCYERLALGEKLHPKQTYKSFEYNTVSKCEMECTQEEEACRAYSFGIGPKGNGTCLLSHDPVKETADLKPIGTIRDTDYDLYIKKLDCQIVVEPLQHEGTQVPNKKPEDFGGKPISNIDHQPNGYGVQDHHVNHDQQPSPYGSLPAQSNYHSTVSNSNEGYHYGNHNHYYPGKPPLPSDDNPNADGLHHVQTAVSIASGYQSVLHPVHDILVSGDQYGQGKPPAAQSGGAGHGGYNENMPPFRPTSLNHPYNDHGELRPEPSPQRPITQDYESGHRPDSAFGDLRPLAPPNMDFGYGHGVHNNAYFNAGEDRPHNFDRPYRPDPFEYRPSEDRPDPAHDHSPLQHTVYGDGGTQLSVSKGKYQSYNKYNSFESEHRYSSDISKRYDSNYNFYDRYEKPSSNYPTRYGSVIPHPNDYSRPDPLRDYLFIRPNSDAYKPSRPDKPEYEGHRQSNYERPDTPRPRPGYEIHNRPMDENVGSGYDKPEVLHQPHSEYDRRPSISGSSSGYSTPDRPNPDYNGEKPTEIGGQSYNKPSRPNYSSNQRPGNTYNRPDPYQHNRPGSSPTTSSRPPSTELSNHYSGVDYTNKQYGKPGEYMVKGDQGERKVISHSIGYNGEKITSIITELRPACFRRTLAGKRVVRSLVRNLLICDTVEQCQQECGDERRFTCEGFNYRLDPTGRGKGECELIDLPLTRIDIARETVTDPDYDFYTRDRNAAQINCRQPPSSSYLPGGGYGSGGGYGYGYGGGGYGDRRGDGTRPYDRRPLDIARPLRPVDRWDDDYGDPRPRPPPIDQRPLPDDDRRYEYGNRRGDYSFHHSHESHSSHSQRYHYNEHNVDRYDYHQHEDHRPYSGIHYLPASPSRRPSYDTHRLDDRFRPPKRHPVIIPLDDKRPNDILPPSRYPPNRYLPEKYPERDRPPQKNYWGLDWERWGSYGGQNGDRYRYYDNRRNYYIPSKPSKPYIPQDWGLYGGSYGTGSLSLEYQGYGNRHTYDYWGLNKFDERRPSGIGSDLLPPRRQGSDGSYLPIPRPVISGSYLPHISGGHEIDNSIFPAEPRIPPTLNLNRDECSLRSATGFRLHKGVVKRFFSVPNIYECELLCFREKEFPCASYSFRYTTPIDNCFLSNHNYKELNYYTDLEPDRDFDIYTMNNPRRCQESDIVLGKGDSDCFWRVRSGQRLDHSVVRDSLSVKSIVDCQLECLKSRRFTCRVYSFRYGSPVIGGAIDNCQLTDWPFFELDSKIHFIPERDFEIYERGSFGHGCEPNHFEIRGKRPPKDNGIKVDQLCYIGFGTAAKLLPQATVKSLYVPTELDCKKECSKARESTVFRCMSFSFVTGAPKIGHNCFLSDIMQRDLLPNVDYVPDPDSWLFTWDNYNPECIDLAFQPLHNEHSTTGIGHLDKYGLDYINPLDVWRVYSVSGWPCKRGTLCKENREAGFWYCELEGGDKHTWDYCCSPDHHCGFSNGYPYSWCYVGPSKTQWRKCNDQYYPYIHNVIDRFDGEKRPWHTSGHFPPPPQKPGYRPDRLNAPQRPIPPKPSLDEYEEEFDNQFLSPPKPGGFGQPRRWPVAYLHKEMPPNATNEDSRARTEKPENSKLSAIKSLIDVIRNTEIKNVQYHISNDSSKRDDILYVQIPLPNLNEPESNSTEGKPKNEFSSNTKVNFEVVDTAREQSSRVQKSLPLHQQIATQSIRKEYKSQISRNLTSEFSNGYQDKFPVYRRGFVTRTNLTSRGSRTL